MMEQLVKEGQLPEEEKIQYLEEHMPLLWKENDLAWDTYAEVCTQIRVAGLGDIIGLDIHAVNLYLDWTGFPNGYPRFKLWHKLCAIFEIQQKHSKASK